MTVVAVLGLGEAGSEISRDLLAAGAVVRAYDPKVAAGDGMVACADEADAARGADVVLSVNSAGAAEEALRSGVRSDDTTLWADLNTASPQLERDLAVIAADRRWPFADVSLMSPVPGRGMRTPMLASGDGAVRFSELMTSLGARVEVLDAPAGEASTRKLLRSVFFKGMAAAVVEAIRAAEQVGLGDWMRAMVTEDLAAADSEFGPRLERGSYQHAVRREEEMAAAVDLLRSLDVPPRVATASRDWLHQLVAERGGQTTVAGCDQ